MMILWYQSRLPLVFALALTGCQGAGMKSLVARVDHTAFQYVGRSFTEKHELRTMKEIHLDTGVLAGREVMVEGVVAEVSRNGTWFVLQDDSARLLVELADVEYMQGPLATDRPKTVTVLGTVESGLKGLPFIKATSVTTVRSAESRAAGSGT